MRDPIVEEVRAVRREIELECSTRETFIERVKKVERRYAQRLVTRKPQPALSSLGVCGGEDAPAGRGETKGE